MKPVIKTIAEKKFIGKRLRMTFAEDKTHLLWKCFMPQRKEIDQQFSSDLFCLQVYDHLYDFSFFKADAEFDKWAAIEVSDFNIVPADMETIILKGGLYAVFNHIGAASEGHNTFRYIFESWLPNSNYTIDNRIHFEVLGNKYKNNDPTSEEEVWIPIKPKIAVV